MRTQNTEHRTQNFIVLLCICSLFLVAGCEEKKQIKTAKQPPVLKQKEVKVSQKSTKANQKGAEAKQVAQDMNSAMNCSRLAAENKQLKEQAETLMGIDKPARIEALSTLVSIELTNRSGLYDKNNDGKKEMLIVYLKPIDDMGDVVKAAGAVVVQLWNLNAKPQESLLKSWEIEPKDLKKNWSGSLLTSYYKMQFDVNSILTGKEKSQTLHSFSDGADLTLKAQFTDYLTGKVLKSQKVINSK